MAYPLNLSDTVDKLATQASATLNWDVVVNYSVPAINQLLAETFKDESKKQIKDIEFDIAVPNPFKHGETVTIHYKFGLGAPLISFGPRGADGPTCDLSFPIVGGTVTVQGGDTDTVPPDLYTLAFGSLFLATASGAEDPNPKSDDQSYDFTDGGKEQGCVIIDLPTSKSLTVNINIDASSKATHVSNIDSYIPFMTASIQRELHSGGKYQDIRYEIARVSSHTPPVGMMQLKPKYFRFDAFLPSDTPKPEDIGVLTLFIQTRDTNHGTQSNLATSWEAQWRTKLFCSPIPEGKTASIMFSKDMVYESVIEPALSAQSFSGKGLSDTTGSLEVHIDTGKRVHRDKFDYEGPYDPLGSTSYSAEAVDVTLPPLKLTLKENSGSPTYATSWDYEYSCKWEYHSSGPSGVSGSIEDHVTKGATTATHTMPKDPNKLPKVATLLDDYSLKMDCSVSKDDWNVTFKGEDRSGWDLFWRGKDTVPQWMKGLDVEIATFDLQLASVDFFLTTNLLFPGDKQVIDVDRTSGLHIPGDLYFVGNVKTKQRFAMHGNSDSLYAIAPTPVASRGHPPAPAMVRTVGDGVTVARGVKGGKAQQAEEKEVFSGVYGRWRARQEVLHRQGATPPASGGYMEEMMRPLQPVPVPPRQHSRAPTTVQIGGDDFDAMTHDVDHDTTATEMYQLDGITEVQSVKDGQGEQGDEEVRLGSVYGRWQARHEVHHRQGPTQSRSERYMEEVTGRPQEITAEELAEWRTVKARGSGADPRRMPREGGRGGKMNVRPEEVDKVIVIGPSSSSAAQRDRERRYSQGTSHQDLKALPGSRSSASPSQRSKQMYARSEITMSETKASKIIKLLNDNDIGPSVFLAISNNDEQAFQSALDDANLTADDLTLSQDEYDNLVKGVKPSGELDILTWEGYYVVTSSSENDPLALLILVGTEKVYWGTQSQVLVHPEPYAVDYKITPDNKIEFTTQTDGLVSISLTREYDTDNATATVKFSGTRDGEAISGEKAQLPIKCLNLQGPFRRKAPAPRMMMMAMAMPAAEPDPEHWYENPIVASFATAFTLLGGLAAGFQVYLWIRDKAWRKERPTQLRDTMEEQAPLMIEIAEDSYREPEVNYSGAPSAVHSSIVSDVNQSINDNPPDYQRSTDELTQEYEPRARDAAAASLQHYIESRSMPDLRRSTDKFRAVPGYEPWVREFGSEVAIQMAEPKIEALAPFDSAVRPVVLEARSEHVDANYAEADRNLQSMEEELRESKAKIADLQDEVTRLSEEIKDLKERGEDASAKEKRKTELDAEERQAEEDQREKEKKRDDAEQEREDAEGHKNEAEHESETDKSREEWEKEAREVFEV